jgi:hypothetical protein
MSLVQMAFGTIGLTKGVVIIYGEGVGKWEGGGGDKRRLTLINTGGQKSFNLEKGGVKNFLNLNTMSGVLISIIPNSRDSQIIMPKR